MSVDWSTILKIEVILAAFGSLVLTIVMAIEAVCRREAIGWPVSGTWLVVGLFAALAIRFGDLAISRLLETDPNPPRTAADWALIVLFMVWVAKRRSVG